MYPKDVAKNKIYRAKLLLKAQNNPQLQMALIKICANNILFWINSFCWTKDQRVRPVSILPFVTYPFQDSAIKIIEQSIDQQYDLLLEKSRDMGASWMVLYVYCHKWIFEEGSDFRCGSRKEDFVDKIGDIDTLLEKIRFTVERLPVWMKPCAYDMSWMRLLNKDTDNAVIGESANEDFGTGGRRKSIFIDEAAKWDNRKIDNAWTSTADVTNCRIIVSTPKGGSNKFAMLAKGNLDKIEKLTLHWTLHPKKNFDSYYIDTTTSEHIKVDPENANSLWHKGYKIRSSWYDAECRRRTENEIAQELDIDYLASGSPFFELIPLRKQIIWKEYEGKDILDKKFPNNTFVAGNLVDTGAGVIFKQRWDGWCKIFELPKAHMEYVIGTDTCEGLPTGDASVSYCIDKYYGNTCAKIRGQYKPEDIAHKSWLLERFYNNALNVPENNNHGYTTCLELDRLGSNLYYSKIYEGKENETTKRGFVTNGSTRAMILDRLAHIISKMDSELRCEDFQAECETFIVKENGRVEADGSFHDDCVVAMAIAQQARHDNPYRPQAADNKIKRRQAVADKRKSKHRGF